ncbi:MAG: PQQ-like beta-propeller repeat protein [Rhodocyclaceae bacterium]|nr:PQQ-like beta-propeller repeat protein [Rhodocyclaceae bacterium]
MQVKFSRRRWLGLAGGALLAWALPAPARAATALVPLARWPTGEARLAPVAAEAGRAYFAGATSLGLIDPQAVAPLWQRPHGLPGGAVFRPRLMSDRLVCAGLRALAAFHAGEGEPLWRYTAKAQIGAPALGADLVCFGDGHELVALELATGGERWRFAALKDTEIHYAPAVAEDLVYVGPGDGRLYALEASSGRLVWRLDRMAEWQYLRQLHLSGDLLIAGSYKEKLYGLERATGRQRWAFPAGNFINSQHVAAGRVHFWSPTGWLYALEAASGRLLWRHRTTDYTGRAGNWAALHAELVTSKGWLFALDLSGTLHRLEAATGGGLTSHPLGEGLHPFVAPLDGRRFFVANAAGELLLYALDVMPA